MASDPILYSFRRCPYAIRSRLALIVSKTSCALREVHLARKPSAMLLSSPKGTVPVLALPDGAVIDESLEIMRWALSRNDPEGWLERDDAELIADNDGDFKYALDRYKYPERYQADARIHQQKGLEFLRRLESRLSQTQYLSGAKRRLTDAAIVPFVRQFAAVEPDWFAVQALSRLQAWLGDGLGSPLFVTAMARHAPWSPGDPELHLPLRMAEAPPAASERKPN